MFDVNNWKIDAGGGGNLWRLANKREAGKICT
jgi:hypothetical protein